MIVLRRLLPSGYTFLKFLLDWRGITAAELLVSISIITIVSAQILVSFTGLNESIALQRSARELALAIRRAQNISLATTQFPGITEPVVAAGVRISRLTGEQNRYFIFIDRANPSRDNRYSGAGSGEKLPQTETIFPRGVVVSSFIGCASNPTCTGVDVIHAIFVAPEATAILTDANGTPVGNNIEITLRAPNLQTVKVIVLTTGQISIR